jgi:uncharacterized membrane protein
MRGVAVLVMIEAHVLDSWTRAADRETSAFGWAITVGGMGAPLFLFLAGVTVPLSAGSKLRRTGDRALATRLVMRRGLEIFGLAFLFRAQAWVLGWGHPRTLLRVDILNIMGPAIAGSAALWGATTTARARVLTFVAATAAIAFATPFVRSWSQLAALPDPLEAYIRPAGGFSMFVLFPWAGFVAAGATLGAVLDDVRTGDDEAHVTRAASAAGIALAGAAFVLSYLPSPLYASYFWTSSPAFFFLRTGLMVALVAPARAWTSRPGAADRSPLAQLGRTSLFIYWIHVEMVYGLISKPLHGSLPLSGVWGAYILFVLFMFGCSVGKDRAAAWWTGRRTRGRAPSPTAAGASGTRG